MQSEPRDPRRVDGAPDPLGVAFAQFAAVLLRHARLFVFFLVLGLGVAAARWYWTGRAYVAESRFRPSTANGDLSRLSGLAAQFGLDGALPTQDETIDFYIELARSREVLRDVALTTYQFPRDADTQKDIMRGDLIKLYHVKAGSERKRMKKVLQRLDKDVAVSPNVKANIVTIRVRAPYAALAEQVNRKLVDNINSFNLKKRQSKSAAERAFVQKTYEQAQKDVTAAENELKYFLERNRRGVDRSPDLSFDRDRLQRRLDLRQQVSASLAQSYEKARIDEVRNTPVITILSSPEGSAFRATSLLRSLAFGLVPALLLALAAVVAVDGLESARRDRPEEFEALDRLARRGRTPRGS